MSPLPILELVNLTASVEALSSRPSLVEFERES